MKNEYLRDHLFHIKGVKGGATCSKADQSRNKKAFGLDAMLVQLLADRVALASQESFPSKVTLALSQPLPPSSLSYWLIAGRMNRKTTYGFPI